jgi:hypothetical protein
LQWVHMVLQYVEKHGEISRAEVAELCHISGPQAYRLLKKLEREGHLTPIGTKGRSVKYERRIGEKCTVNAWQEILMHSCISGAIRNRIASIFEEAISKTEDLFRIDLGDLIKHYP